MTNSTPFQAEKINEFIVKWLFDYATNAKVKGFVVGIYPKMAGNKPNNCNGLEY